jgi:hypothetical protein
MSRAMAERVDYEWSRSRYKLLHDRGEAGRLARLGAERGIFDVAAARRWEKKWKLGKVKPRRRVRHATRR